MAEICKPSPSGHSRAVLKQIMASPELTRAVFGLSDSPLLKQIHLQLLARFMETGKQNVWPLIRAGPAYQLALTNEMLSTILSSAAKSENNILTCFRLLNTMEDAFLKEPSLVLEGEFAQTLARILLLFHRADLLYVSLPWVSLFDERTLLGPEKERSLLGQLDDLESNGETLLLREGGSMRILLRLLFFFAKLNPSPDLHSCTLLRFFLFRDEKSGKAVREIAVVPSSASPKTGCYNALDLMIRSDPEKIKQHTRISEFVANKAAPNEASLFDVRRLQKATQTFALKERCMFEQGPVLAALVCCELFQLIQELEKAGMNNSSPEVKDKTKGLVGIVEEVMRYSPRMGEVLGEQFVKIVDGAGNKQRASGFFLKKAELKLGTVYTVLDAINLTPQVQGYSMSTSVEDEKPGFIPYEGLMVSSSVAAEALGVLAKSQQDLLAKFCAGEWTDFMKLFLSTEPAGIVRLLVSPNVLSTIQPCLHFFTTHSLNMVDGLITRRGQAASLGVRKSERKEMEKFMGEFEERIRDRFCYISIHAEKIGMFAKLMRGE